MRLQKYMAKCGVASRRKSEEIILEKRVTVNDKIISELGYKVDENKDLVKVDGSLIQPEENKVYILLNKPVGYTTTLKDKYSDKKVIDLIGDVEERIYPVGRLDQDSRGLLLLTNDGDLTYKLTHPSYEVKKTYIAKVSGITKESDLDKLRNGVFLDGSLTAKAKIEIVDIKKNDTYLKVIIHEGRNRQVRRMFDTINHPVLDLERVALGEINLSNLAIGDWRYLSDKEIKSLKELVSKGV